MQTVIDASRLRHNIRTIRSLTKTRFCAVVKADAYGHGIAVAAAIERMCDCFMVATAREAVELSLIVKKPILVMGGEVSELIKHPSSRLIPTVSSVSELNAVVSAGFKTFSVAVNTGMNRFGADGSALNAIASRCEYLGITPHSVYSHIYGGISSAPEQSERFDISTARPIFCGNKHIYSSCALDLSGFPLYDMIRCGLAMYGYSRYTDICMRVRAPVVSLRRISRGEHIGYGDCVSDRDMVIATVKCGYADGFYRSDRPLYLKVRGKKCAVVGSVCMDCCFIDVTDAELRVGEYAYVIEDKEDTEYLAKCRNTIIYEVLTGFNGRAERIYV